MPRSNELGRTLEYAIVEAIVSNLPKANLTFTTRLKNNQIRDRAAFYQLSAIEQDQHRKYAFAVYSWLNEDFHLSKQMISIDRLSDSDAIAGDVTDIRISFAGRSVNLSVKHNHSALKHQRPPTTALQCGFASKSEEDVNFRANLKTITTAFIQKSRTSYPSALLFNEIKSQSQGFIETELYLPICKLVSDFINKKVKDSHVKSLFSFLVGNTEFYKVTASNNQITIEEFAKITKPGSVKASMKAKNYVVLNFNNGWTIEMRLHTASSRIGNTPSLKFDTQLVNSTIPKRTIECIDSEDLL